MKVDLSYIQEAMSSQAYNELMETYAKKGKSTGINQSEAYLNYTKLNAQRMRRLHKTAVLTDQMKQGLAAIEEKQHWFILTESWCGDAANILPFYMKMEEENKHIQLHFLLRDENPELMNQFLTNGGKSIPKIIATAIDGNTLFDWGPRPKPAQAIYDQWRNSVEKAPYQEVQVTLQKWYNNDKGETLQLEWKELMDNSLAVYTQE